MARTSPPMTTSTSITKTKHMNSLNRRSRSFPPLLLALFATLFPSHAHAHWGVDHVHMSGDLIEGIRHPFSGLDHLCAIIAVGLWAAQRGGRSMWLLPLTFVSAM